MITKLIILLIIIKYDFTIYIYMNYNDLSTNFIN